MISKNIELLHKWCQRPLRCHAGQWSVVCHSCMHPPSSLCGHYCHLADPLMSPYGPSISIAQTLSWLHGPFVVMQTLCCCVDPLLLCRPFVVVQTLCRCVDPLSSPHGLSCYLADSLLLSCRLLSLHGPSVIVAQTVCHRHMDPLLPLCRPSIVALWTLCYIAWILLLLCRPFVIAAQTLLSSGRPSVVTVQTLSLLCGPSVVIMQTLLLPCRPSVIAAWILPLLCRPSVIVAQNLLSSHRPSVIVVQTICCPCTDPLLPLCRPSVILTCGIAQASVILVCTV